MKNIDIFIGIPTKNSEMTIQKTIDSLLNQTYQNYYVLISDNCSSDNTVDIVKKIIKKFSNFKIVQQKKDIGAINNFDYLLKKANKKYFMWLASDDFLSPDFLYRTRMQLEKEQDTDLVFTKYQIHDSTGKKYEKILKKPNLFNNKHQIIKGYYSVINYNKFKLNYALYGLFKKESLTKVISQFPVCNNWDRILIILLFLKIRINYCNKGTYIKYKHNISNKKRYPNEQYNVFDFLWRIKIPLKLFIFLKQNNVSLLINIIISLRYFISQIHIIFVKQYRKIKKNLFLITNIICKR